MSAYHDDEELANRLDGSEYAKCATDFTGTMTSTHHGSVADDDYETFDLYVEAERWLAVGEKVAANLTVCAWALGIMAALYALSVGLDFFGWPLS